MGKKEELTNTEEVEEFDLDSVNDKVEALKEDVEMLKKLKRKQKKLSKLEKEKNKILADMVKGEKKSRKKHK